MLLGNGALPTTALYAFCAGYNETNKVWLVDVFSSSLFCDDLFRLSTFKIEEDDAVWSEAFWQ
jgi:hypothetical protein